MAAFRHDPGMQDEKNGGEGGPGQEELERLAREVPADDVGNQAEHAARVPHQPHGSEQGVSFLRFDGHHGCGGQAASAVSYSPGLK